MYVWGDTVGSVAKLKKIEKVENIRVGGYVGVVLWGGTVGWYGGVVCGVVRIMKSLYGLNVLRFSVK